MPSDREALHILEHKARGFEFADNANKFLYERVPRIVERAMPDQREPLARRSAEDDIDFSVSDPRTISNFVASQIDNRFRDHRATRKIERVRRAMNRIDFDRRDHIETGLFETQTEPAGPREKVYSYGSHPFQPVVSPIVV